MTNIQPTCDPFKTHNWPDMTGLSAGDSDQSKSIDINCTGPIDFHCYNFLDINDVSPFDI